MKETINKTKRQTTEWKEIFANDISDKGLMSKIYNELMQLKKTNQPNKQTTSQLKNGGGAQSLGHYCVVTLLCLAKQQSYFLFSFNAPQKMSENKK